MGLADGIGGGGMDARALPMDARGLVPAPLVLDGVPVREFVALDDAVPSCFVGDCDFVGD